MAYKWLPLVGLAAVLGGAGLLYTGLSGNAAPNRLAAPPALEQNAPQLDTGGSVSSNPQTFDQAAQMQNNTNSTSGTDTAPSAQEQRTPAPDFTVIDADGNEVSLSALRGKPVVLNFWASWCPPCKGEMPDFEQAYLTHGENIQFMMVNLTDGERETTTSAKDYLSAQGYTMPAYFDVGGSAALTYRVYSIPSTYFINADGEIVSYALGALDAASLEQGITLLQG